MKKCLFLSLLLSVVTHATESSKYECTLLVAGRGIKGTSKTEFSTTSVALNVNEYTLTISKEDFGGESLQLSLSSPQSELCGTVVPIGTPSAVIVLNTRDAMIVQGHCVLKQ